MRNGHYPVLPGTDHCLAAGCGMTGRRARGRVGTQRARACGSIAREPTRKDSMAETVHLVPIDAIDEAALIRDRAGLEPEALEELRASIAAGGLRMPVEVFALGAPREGPHARADLGISAAGGGAGAARGNRGRAVCAHRRVRAGARGDRRGDGGDGGGERDREELSPWERGRMLVMARDMGVFGSIEAAVDGLHPAAGRDKRARLRALARVAEELEGQFTAPERLSQAEMLRLAAACRAGFARVICTAWRRPASTTRTCSGRRCCRC